MSAGTPKEKMENFIAALIEKWIAIPTLEEARKQLLRVMVVTFAVLAFPAVISGSIEAFILNQPLMSLQYISVYLPIVWIAAFPHSLSFRWQSRTLLGIMVVASSANLLTYGYSGAGMNILLTVSVLTTMLLGGWAGIISCGISAAAIGLAGTMICTGRVEIIPALSSPSLFSPAAWMSAVITYIMLSIVTVAAVSLVQTFLQHALQSAQDQRRQLVRSEAQYRLLAESTHDLIVTHDRDGKITYANSKVVALSGDSQAQLYTKSFTDLISQESRQTVLEHTAKLWSGERAQCIFETTLVNPAGPSVQVEVIAAPIYEDREMTGILMNARDITDRKRSADALAEERHLLRTVINNVPDHIYAKDTGGRFLMANNAVVHLHGAATEKELLGKSDFDFYPRAIAEAFYTIDQEIIRSGEPLISHEGFYLDETTRRKGWTSITKVPLRDSQGHIEGIVGVNRDITQSKQTEDALRSALEHTQLLIRELYHRTKNNMQVITAMLMLQAGHFEDPLVLKAFRETANRIQSMALVHDRLYQSQDLSSISLDAYIRSLADLCMASYEASPNQIDLTFDMEEISALIDIVMPCGLILHELMSNALEHAFPDPRKGQIQISLRHTGAHEITLEVADDGVGVPPGFDFRETGTFGLQSILAIAEHQLQGTVVFETGHGVRCRLRFRDDLYRARV